MTIFFLLQTFGRTSEASTRRKDWFKPFRHYRTTPALQPSLEQLARGVLRDNSSVQPILREDHAENTAITTTRAARALEGLYATYCLPSYGWQQ